MFFQSKFNLKTFRILLVIFGDLAIQAFYPFVVISSIYQKSMLTPEQQAELPISYETMDLVMIAGIFGVVATIINYQIISRKMNEKLFGRRNREWFKCLEIPVLLAPVIYLVIFPTNIYAMFACLQKNREWFMAPRGVVKSKSA